jgi:pseudouridine kinase
METIVCIGGANIDRKLRSLDALRMGTSNPAEQLETFGGVARNVAENLARLGLPTALVSAVGDDATGAALLQQAEAAGLATSHVLRVAGAPTGSYTAVLDATGQMLLALAAMPLAERLTPHRLQASAALRARAACTVLDLNLPADSLAALLAEARADGRMLLAVAVSEPKMARLPRDLRGLQCLILNRGELHALLQEEDDESSDEAGLAALHRRGVRQVVLTRGPAGLLCSEAGAPALALAAPAVERIVDVTGAGDALAAGVCAGLCLPPRRDPQPDSQQLARACRIGLALAALTLQTSATVHPALSPAWLAAQQETGS